MYFPIFWEEKYAIHVRFFFCLNSILLFPKYREINLFSQDSYNSCFLSEWYPYTLTLTNSTSTFVCLLSLSTYTSPSCYLFLPQLPGPPNIPSQDDVKPIKKTSQIHMFNIFERIRKVPQQRGVPYLKETQPEWKAETCIVERDPFTFIW